MIASQPAPSNPLSVNMSPFKPVVFAFGPSDEAFYMSNGDIATWYSQPKRLEFATMLTVMLGIIYHRRYATYLITMVISVPNWL